MVLIFFFRKPEWPKPSTPYTPDNPLVIAFNENQKLLDNGTGDRS